MSSQPYKQKLDFDYDVCLSFEKGNGSRRGEKILVQFLSETGLSPHE